MLSAVFESRPFQMFPTWVWELAFVTAVLALVALVSGGTGPAWLAALAVVLTFAHVQVATRLDEAEMSRPVAVVVCRAWLDRYLVAKEAVWVALFAITGAWPAVVGCAVFLLYPGWRRFYRRARGSRVVR